MSLQWIEQLTTTRPTDKDNKGHVAVIRRGIVATDSPDAARAADFAPLAGDTFIDSGKVLKCDRIVTAPTGRGQTQLDAYYSNDGRFNAAPPRTNTDPPDATDWVWGSRLVNIEIPVNVHTKVTLSEGSPAVNTTLKAWGLRKIVIQENQGERILIARVPCPPPEQLHTFDIIDKQRGKIHTIRGGKYLYDPPQNNVRKIDAATYEIRHVWVKDAGTEMPTGSAITDPEIFIYPPGPVGPGIPLRSPYARLDVIAPDDPFQPFGYWKTVERFDHAEDADGWRFLPGVPPL